MLVGYYLGLARTVDHTRLTCANCNSVPNEIRSHCRIRMGSHAPSSSDISLTRLRTSMVASPPLSSRPAKTSATTHFLRGNHLPAALAEDSAPGAEGTTAWYFGPTRVAARGKMRSSGSTARISSPQSHPAGALTKRVFRDGVQSVATSVSLAFPPPAQVRTQSIGTATS